MRVRHNRSALRDDPRLVGVRQRAAPAIASIGAHCSLVRRRGVTRMVARSASRLLTT